MAPHLLCSLVTLLVLLTGPVTAPQPAVRPTPFDFARVSVKGARWLFQGLDDNQAIRVSAASIRMAIAAYQAAPQAQEYSITSGQGGSNAYVGGTLQAEEGRSTYGGLMITFGGWVGQGCNELALDIGVIPIMLQWLLDNTLSRSGNSMITYGGVFYVDKIPSLFIAIHATSSAQQGISTWAGGYEYSSVAQRALIFAVDVPRRGRGLLQGQPTCDSALGGDSMGWSGSVLSEPSAERLDVRNGSFPGWGYLSWIPNRPSAGDYANAVDCAIAASYLLDNDQDRKCLSGRNRSGKFKTKAHHESCSIKLASWTDSDFTANCRQVAEVADNLLSLYRQGDPSTVWAEALYVGADGLGKHGSVRVEAQSYYSAGNCGSKGNPCYA